ncbi:hypothetical protein Y032_0008g101 [Ancylostoma ceylanicum]|uniref:Uncharacterized protein n=1 Tax=Ancylostoma ceylanicum TaxID=53326 RepID=A0A016VKV7_9BILA|nr:hypothetical protein Y032_0008g101 [Ancylostoma ceylanicum]
MNAIPSRTHIIRTNAYDDIDGESKLAQSQSTTHVLHSPNMFAICSKRPFVTLFEDLKPGFPPLSRLTSFCNAFLAF